MKRGLMIPLLCGLIFGAGLVLSGMSNPGNVIAFLDITGRWNPALAFVMGGAIAVAAPAYWWVRRGARTVSGEAVSLPPRTGVSTRLIAGSLVFGVGWGLAGICPGPAVVMAGVAAAGGAGLAYPLAFLLSMLSGLVVAGWLASRRLEGKSTITA